MKKFINKVIKDKKPIFIKCGSLLASIAMAVLVFEVNSSCTYYMYQPELPSGSENSKRYNNLFLMG